jgi:nucleoid DNA-binding protein
MSKKRMSKSQFVTILTEKSGLTKKQATSALATINTMVAQHLASAGPARSSFRVCLH